MKVRDGGLPGVLVVETRRFTDERGWFCESFNARSLAKALGTDRFVQDNHSCSARGVLRGIHYQIGPHPQGKLVRCTAGRIYDVVVDIRRRSPTCGRWWGIELDAERDEQLWVPVGFAHGFLALVDGSEVQYKVTDYWDPDGERCIRWDDPDLGIDWPVDGQPIVSAKDAAGSAFRQAEVFE